MLRSIEVPDIRIATFPPNRPGFPYGSLYFFFDDCNTSICWAMNATCAEELPEMVAAIADLEERLGKAKTTVRAFLETLPKPLEEPC